MKPFSRQTAHRLAVLIILVAVLFRAWLIAVDGVSFDSDEAIVGLMARHITQGDPIPTFFYGQAYMGSLDAILVAGGFVLFGESVDSIRVVQMALYLLALASAYALALVITRRTVVALAALLLLAIPTALGALYTTITLGGYNELIVFGNLILLLGWQITVEQKHDLGRWALLGLITGAGWWVNGAIATPALVVVLLGLRYRAWRDGRGVLIAAALFIAGGAPWWLYNLRHDWAALEFLTGGYGSGGAVETLSPLESLVALLLLGLPALYGLRLPWEAGFAFTAWAALAGLVYLALVADLITVWIARRRPDYEPPPPELQRARGWVWLVFAVFAVIFVFSSFADATGRYLMPLWVPASVGVALGLERFAGRSRAIAAGALAVLVATQAITVITAARTDTGLQPQLVERLQIPRGHDQDVIDFLRAEGYTHGYASYWTAYRLTFRAHEDVILDSTLPHEDKAEVGTHNRYEPYENAVDAAPRAAWITQNYPELDTLLEQRFAAQDITFQARDFGPYRVYTNFSRRVQPGDIGLARGVTAESLLVEAGIIAPDEAQ